MYSSTLLVAGIATSVLAGYTVNEDFMSGNFFDHFNFINQPDPTHGFVNYVDQGTAASAGYINTNNGQAYMGVDSTNVASGSGRNSVRVSSKSSFNEALIILDLAHMPTGMGTWPAFWTFGPDWPNQGEIDIIEGVNDQTTNFMTFHSGNAACKMQSTGTASLSIFSTDCYAYDNGNEGCSYHDSDTSSYGAGFNQAQGGVFAMEYTGDTVSIWKWANGASPADALGTNPDPSTWGAPRAQWLSTADGSCDLKTAIRNQNIVFDTTFCGDWAGAVFPGVSGSGSAYPNACSDFVANNPSAYSDAFWQVRSLRVYTTDGQSSPPPAPTTTQEAPPPPPSSTSTESSAAATTSTEAPPPPPPTTTTDTSSTTSTTSTTSIVPVVTPTSESSSSSAATSTTDAPPPPPVTSTTDAAVTSTDSSSSTDVVSTSQTTDSSAAATTSTVSSITSTTDDTVPTSTSTTLLTTSTSNEATSTAAATTSATSTASTTAGCTEPPAPTPSVARPSSPLNDPHHHHGFHSHHHSHHHSVSAEPKPVGPAPTPVTPVSSTSVVPVNVGQTDLPWSVVILPDGSIGEVQEPEEPTAETRPHARSIKRSRVQRK